MVRGYLDNGLDLYMELFKLAKDNQIDGEFGLIDACSFFAENCSDFKRKFPKENLNLIIEKCYGVTIRKYDELKDLSSRKQIQVCFCLLNLVLFYYEQDGDYKREIYCYWDLFLKKLVALMIKLWKHPFKLLLVQHQQFPNLLIKQFNQKLFALNFIRFYLQSLPSIKHRLHFIQQNMEFMLTKHRLLYDF